MAYIINERTLDISMVKGDSAEIPIKLTSNIFSTGDKILFIMANDSGVRKLTKEITEFDSEGYANIIITPEDTDLLDVGTYKHQIKWEHEGKRDTINPESSTATFEIKPSV